MGPSAVAATYLGMYPIEEGGRMVRHYRMMKSLQSWRELSSAEALAGLRFAGGDCFSHET